jgi:hypothetical protein
MDNIKQTGSIMDYIEELDHRILCYKFITLLMMMSTLSLDFLVGSRRVFSDLESGTAQVILVVQEQSPFDPSLLQLRGTKL